MQTVPVLTKSIAECYMRMDNNECQNVELTCSMSASLGSMSKCP